MSAAKAALEAHCRQLAMELARRETGVSVNAIRAGVTDTPAMAKIPEAARCRGDACRNRMDGVTTTQEVAEAIVRFIRDRSDWIIGNVIGL